MRPRISETVVFNDESGVNQHAAIITGVHSDTVVNLILFVETGVVTARLSVEHGTGPGQWQYASTEQPETKPQ